MPPPELSRTPCPASGTATKSWALIGSFRRGERREAGWVGRYYFRFAPLANRHAGSHFTYSTRAGKTGLTKVKNFSDEGLRVSRWNEFLADGMSFLTECLHAGDMA